MAAKRIENFEIASEISRSANSIILRAYDADRGEVVLKAFQFDDSSDISHTEQVSRFKRECDIHLSVRHPHIIPAYQSLEHEGSLYLVLKYMPFQSLRKIIDSQRPVSLLFTLHLVQQLCQVINFLHDQGIIHRDIKPENLLISEDGELFLTDFGCARKVFAPNITQTKLIQGTLNYMSPEQLMGRDDLDFRTDVFSIGVILYQLLTSQLPFKGDNPTDIVQNLLYNEPAPLRKFNAQIPLALENIVAQALQKDPDYRIPTAKKLEQELHKLMADPAVYYSQALWAKEQQAPESVKEYCLLALQQDPNHLPSWQLLGTIYHQLNAWDEARECYEFILKHQSGNASVYFNLGTIASAQEDFETALKMFERAWVLEPENRNYEIHVTYALQALGREEDALEHYQGLLTRYPEWALPLFHIGRLYYHLNQKEVALRHFKQAHGIDPNHMDILYNLGSLLHELGYYHDALSIYKQYARIKPNDSQIMHNMAVLYYHMGELIQARQLAEGIAQDQKWESAHILLGFIHIRLNLYEEAIESFKHAIACNPHNLSTYLHLASTYHEKYRLNDAIATLEYVASQEIGMHHASVYYLLANAYARQGRYREAIASLERCLRCEDVTMKMADQAKKELHELKDQRRRMDISQLPGHLRKTNHLREQLHTPIRYVV